jgi:hypothetical protein
VLEAEGSDRVLLILTTLLARLDSAGLLALQAVHESFVVANDRARSDLAAALGETEAALRASLNRTESSLSQQKRASEASVLASTSAAEDSYLEKSALPGMLVGTAILSIVLAVVLSALVAKHMRGGDESPCVQHVVSLVLSLASAMALSPGFVYGH